MHVLGMCFMVFTENKPKKSPGSDSVEPEHIIFGGESLVSLLACIFSAVVRAGRLPDSLCHGLIIPIPKGSGKDLTNPSNYAWVSLSFYLDMVEAAREAVS